MMMESSHLPDKLWDGAAKVSFYILNKTSSVVLDSKVPVEIWNDEPLGSLKTFMRGFASNMKTLKGVIDVKS